MTFYIFKLAQVPNFVLKLTQKPKRVFPIFLKKRKLPLNSTYSNQSRFEISASTNNFDFWKKFQKKRILPVENRKNEHHHRILHIRISLDTNFQLKLTILIFLTKFTKNGYFQSKTDKMETTTEFCIIQISVGSKFQF